MTVQRSRCCGMKGVVVMAFLLPLGACGPLNTRSPVLDASRVLGGVDLTLENRHVMDMRVYFVRPGVKVRIATLSTAERKTVQIPYALLGTGGGFQLYVEAIASRVGHMSEWMPAVAGNTATYTIGHRLYLSNGRVRSR